jgi:hypothetical protein
MARVRFLDPPLFAQLLTILKSPFPQTPLSSAAAENQEPSVVG